MSMPTTATISGTVTFPAQPLPPIQPPPPMAPSPTMCFMCIRSGHSYPMLASTVYKGTYLCNNCVKALPDELVINEFPPSTL